MVVEMLEDRPETRRTVIRSVSSMMLELRQNMLIEHARLSHLAYNMP